MTFEEYIVAACNYAINEKSQRTGQAYSNTLKIHRPDLAELVLGDPMYDPFYVDANIPRFLGLVAANW